MSGVNTCNIVTEQNETAKEFDQWMLQHSLMSAWMRYWFSPERVVFLNTPVLKLAYRLSLNAADRVLDIGCGFGGMLIYLHEKIGFREIMEGIDVSSFMVRSAQEEIRRRRLEGRIKIRKCLGTNLPYADETFDVVLSSYVIKHLSDFCLCLMMKEARRVLKPGGHFCFWEAGQSRFRMLNCFNRKLMTIFLSKVHLRPLNELRQRMEETGFRDIERFGQGPFLYHPIMPRVGLIGSK